MPDIRMPVTMLDIIEELIVSIGQSNSFANQKQLEGKCLLYLYYGVIYIYISFYILNFRASTLITLDFRHF